MMPRSAGRGGAELAAPPAAAPRRAGRRGPAAEAATLPRRPAPVPAFSRSRPRRHHRRRSRRHRCAADRSASAADRDLTAAQGPLLRGVIAAQCRQRRRSSPPRIFCPMPKPARCCRSSTTFRCCAACRWSGGCSLKNRDIGLFCNLSAATLTDAGFPQLLEFLEANRAIAPSLVFEFTQSAVRSHGADRAREPCGACRARISLFHGQSHRSSPRAARTDRARLSLHQGVGGAVAQPGRRQHDQHPSRRISPTCSAVSASISSPSGSRANRRWSIFSITMSASARAFCFRRRGRCARKRCRAAPAMPAGASRPRWRARPPQAKPLPPRQPARFAQLASAARNRGGTKRLARHHRTICTAGARLRRSVVRRLGRRAQRRCRFRAGLRGADALSRRWRHGDPHHQCATAGRFGAANSRPAQRAARRL